MTYDEMVAQSTPRPWEWTIFTHHSGRDIETVQDVADTLAQSALKGTRAELWGATERNAEPELDGGVLVILHSGNGPKSSSNAALAVRAVNAFQPLVEALEAFIDWHGAAHSQGCPADDTCDCEGGEINAKVNAALKLAKEGR